MIAALIIAAGTGAGADWRLLALVAGAVWMPIPAGVAVAAAIVIGRRIEREIRSGVEIRFVDVVLAELRSGASVRSALIVGCETLANSGGLVRNLRTGQPVGVALGGLVDRLPDLGALVVSAVEAGADGGYMMPALEELSEQARADAAARSELRMAMAPVKASMWILAGGPSLYLIWMIATGRFAVQVAAPGGLWLAMVGGALFGLGLVVMAAMVRWRR